MASVTSIETTEPNMNSLSIFVDEAGDFGHYEPHEPFYVLTLVFHNQQNSIGQEVSYLNDALKHTAHVGGRAVHTGPLIRREDEYSDMSVDERRSQFMKLLAFQRKCPIQYISFVFKKREYSEIALMEKMYSVLLAFLRRSIECLQGFDNVIIYYDDGQREVKRVLHAAFDRVISNAEFRFVQPSHYKLAQVADLICTIELLDAKRTSHMLTKSDRLFFYKAGELRRIIKTVQRRKING